MNFMTVKEASLLWNMDVSRIGKLLKEGRISGAEKTGGHWYIPRNAAKPIDRRTRQGINQSEPCFFRFPLYVNKDEKQFYPQLTDDEILLRQAQLNFFAFEFEKSLAGFKYLEENSKSTYIKICALFFECVLTVAYQSGKGFNDCLRNLKLEFKHDFPYKREMELVFPWLYSFLGNFVTASKSLSVDPCYPYHPSVCPLLSYISVFHTLKEDLSPLNLDSYLITCSILELDGFFYEAQELHMILYIFYFSLAKEDAARYHLRRALDIAKEHNLIVAPACYEYYYPDMYHIVLQDYPKDFSEKILACSSYLHESYARFGASYNITDMYDILSQDEYQYILYAAQGFKYSEIAKFLDISERTVASRYSIIFEKLGVKNKKDLVDLFYDTVGPSLP